MRETSSARAPPEYPPITKTRDPSEAIAWDDLPRGLGPTFWKLNHRSAAFPILHMNKVTAEHAKSLTRQVKGKQIIQISFVCAEPTKDIHNTIDNDSSVT